MKNLPFVSIIMPIRNESAHIERSLRAVLTQDYPCDLLEVLIADGNSSDDTRAKIAQISQSFPDFWVIVVDNPDQYMPMGFNRALRHARGDVVIMLGGHTEISLDYVKQCVQLLQETSAFCVGGAMETVAIGLASEAITIGMSSMFGVGGVAFRTMPDKVMEVDTSVFAAYRREVFHQIGGLDEEMIRNQDDEFNYRLRAHGGKILFSPAIRSRYYSRDNLSSLWRQYFQYGYWKVRVLQKHPMQMSPRQFMPPLFVLALLASLGFALSANFRLLALLIPLLYGATNLLASLWTASQRGWKYLWLLPMVFAILHLSYGLGFLVGLVKFWNRWGDNTGRVPAWTNEPAD